MSRIHFKDVDGGHQECERVHFGESDEPELSQRLIISEFNLAQRQILKCIKKNFVEYCQQFNFIKYCHKYL